MMKFRIVDQWPVDLELSDFDADTVFDRERLAVALDQLTAAGCKHNMGDHAAEQATVNGRTVTHYRCNGCNIILRTA